MILWLLIATAITHIAAMTIDAITTIVSSIATCLHGGWLDPHHEHKFPQTFLKGSFDPLFLSWALWARVGHPREHGLAPRLHDAAPICFISLEAFVIEAPGIWMEALLQLLRPYYVLLNTCHVLLNTFCVLLHTTCCLLLAIHYCLLCYLLYLLLTICHSISV